MSIKLPLLITMTAFLFASTAIARTSAPDGAQVYFISPKDGAVVNSPVVIKFGLKGMGIAPAGIEKANTGHHHLLINVPNTPALDKPLPADDRHKHFGGGQTEASITLPPGKHSLQLLLGDHHHIPHNPPVMSKKISITVK